MEILSDHPLQSYSLTGAGLKHRAHPLAISIALNQPRKLASFHKTKSYFATKSMLVLCDIPFFEMPDLRLSNNTHSAPAWYALILRFKREKAPKNLTRETFVCQLLKAGLRGIDIAKSTGLLHQEPLFTNPAGILPHIQFQKPFLAPCSVIHFTKAQGFYDEAIKLPVFADMEDEAVVDHYLHTIRAAACVNPR